MDFLFIFLFVLLAIFHAYENYCLIKTRQENNDSRPLNHYTESLKYIGGCILFGLFAYYISDWSVWCVLGFSVLTRMVFFDISLNLFRGLRISYENPNAKGSSIIDRIEQVLPFWHRWCIYFAFYIILIFNTVS